MRILFVLLSLIAATVSIPQQNGVLLLSKSTFQQAIDLYSPLFVLFDSPTRSGSLTLFLRFTDAATAVRIYGWNSLPTARFGMYDVTQSSDHVVSDYIRVMGLPVLMRFRCSHTTNCSLANGNIDVYDGGRTSMEFQRYVLQQPLKSVVQVNTRAQLDIMVHQTPFVALFVIDDIDSSSYFDCQRVAQLDSELSNYVVTTNTYIMEQGDSIVYLQRLPAIILFRAFGQEQVVYDGTWNRADIATFIRINKYSIVSTYSNAQSSFFYDRGAKGHVLLFSDVNASYHASILTSFNTMAQQYYTPDNNPSKVLLRFMVVPLQETTLRNAFAVLTEQLPCIILVQDVTTPPYRMTLFGAQLIAEATIGWTFLYAMSTFIEEVYPPFSTSEIDDSGNMISSGARPEDQWMDYSDILGPSSTIVTETGRGPIFTVSSIEDDVAIPSHGEATIPSNITTTFNSTITTTVPPISNGTSTFNSTTIPSISNGTSTFNSTTIPSISNDTSTFNSTTIPSISNGTSTFNSTTIPSTVVPTVSTISNDTSKPTTFAVEKLIDAFQSLDTVLIREISDTNELLKLWNGDTSVDILAFFYSPRCYSCQEASNVLERYASELPSLHVTSIIKVNIDRVRIRPLELPLDLLPGIFLLLPPLNDPIEVDDSLAWLNTFSEPETPPSRRIIAMPNTRELTINTLVGFLDEHFKELNGDCFSSSTDRFTVQGELTQISKGLIPQVGVTAHLVHTFQLDDTIRFAKLNGDNNPIHTQVHTNGDPPIVQGMLTASLFATIFGRTIPGVIYISQELRWREPLFVDESVCARIRVVRQRKRFVECETICEKTVDGVTSVVVEGKATVLIPSTH